VIQQASKLIAPNIQVIFIDHAYPQNALAKPPFCIINDTHLKEKEDIYKLFITLIELSQMPVHEDGEIPKPSEVSFKLYSVLKQC
jgi:hypothetical protein